MQPLNFDNFHQPVSLRERLQHPTVWYFMASVGGAVLAGLGGLVLVIIVAVTASVPEAIVLGLFCAMLVVGFIIAAWYSHANLPQHGDVARFAQDNGMTYSTHQDLVRRPGFFFENIKDGYFSDILTSPAHGMSEIGTFTELIQHKGRTYTKKRGYIRIKLPRRLPHIILDSRHDDAFGMSLQLGGLQGEHLQLEGDFNRYFRLIAPRGYATDALYIFTPDIMQILINSVRKYDCEIVDDNFYIHSETAFKLGRQSELQELFNIIDQLHKKLIRRTDYYADSRVQGSREANVVATKGVRIKRKFSIYITVVIVVLAVVLQLLQLGG